MPSDLSFPSGHTVVCIYVECGDPDPFPLLFYLVDKDKTDPNNPKVHLAARFSKFYRHCWIKDGPHIVTIKTGFPNLALDNMFEKAMNEHGVPGKAPWDVKEEPEPYDKSKVFGVFYLHTSVG